MNQIWTRIILILSILVGISFLVFVLRMIWFPPGSMGMMMGSSMMFHHLSFWLSQMIWIFLIMLGGALLVWLFLRRRK